MPKIPAYFLSIKQLREMDLPLNSSKKQHKIDQFFVTSIRLKSGVRVIEMSKNTVPYTQFLSESMTQVMADLYPEEHEILQTHLMYKTMQSIMINNNQGLVDKNTAKLWTWGLRSYKIQRGRPEYQDLYQMGNLGLIRAIQKYDASKGAQFSTYATHWIQSFIRRHIQRNQFCVTVPVAAKTQQNFSQIQDFDSVTYMLKDLHQEDKIERYEDIEKLTVFLDYLHDLLGTEDYQILLTSYGIFDHEKFKDNENFENFIQARKDQRIQFYQSMHSDQQFRYFGFESKQKYQERKGRIVRKIRLQKNIFNVSKVWDKLER